MNTRPRYTNSDPWQGISHDVISRFLEVLMTEHALSRKTRVAYRVDLHKLDCWMQLTRRRTAIAATSEDLNDYFAQQLSARHSSWTLKRARNSARRFYAFLRECHYRDDDPMPRRIVAQPDSVDAYAEHGLEVAAY